MREGRAFSRPCASFVQEHSVIQSPSDIMKIIRPIITGTLIKTGVCNYSRPAQDNGDTWEAIPHPPVMQGVTGGP